MPVIYDIRLNLDMEQVLRRQGIRDRAKLRPQFTTLSRELLDIINELHLLRPAIAYELHPVVQVSNDKLWLGSGMVLQGCLLARLLGSAVELAAIVCTIGPHLEEKVADYFAQNDPLRAVLLDGIGSAAVDILAQEACKLVQREAALRGYEASSPFSPGMHGFPLTAQWTLLRLVPAGQIGVHLTSSAMMVPCKSTSMVLGLGPEMPTWTQAEACQRCNLNSTCRYRVYAPQEVKNRA